MELDRKDKAPVPAEVWALAVVKRGKVAVKEAAGDKEVVVARDRDKAKARGAVRDKAKAVDKSSRLVAFTTRLRPPPALCRWSDD
jgi:hypothetical protein